MYTNTIWFGIKKKRSVYPIRFLRRSSINLNICINLYVWLFEIIVYFTLDIWTVERRRLSRLYWVVPKFFRIPKMLYLETYRQASTILDRRTWICLYFYGFRIILYMSSLFLEINSNFGIKAVLYLFICRFKKSNQFTTLLRIFC